MYPRPWYMPGQSAPTYVQMGALKRLAKAAPTYMEMPKFAADADRLASIISTYLREQPVVLSGMGQGIEELESQVSSGTTTPPTSSSVMDTVTSLASAAANIWSSIEQTKAIEEQAKQQAAAQAAAFQQQQAILNQQIELQKQKALAEQAAAQAAAIARATPEQILKVSEGPAGGLPGWALPVALVGGAAVIGYMFLRKR